MSLLMVIAIVVGLVGGIVAVMTLPSDRRDPGGGIIPVLLGLIGSVAGSFAGRAIGDGWIGHNSGEPSYPGFIPGILGALIGASAVLILYRILTRKATAD